MNHIIKIFCVLIISTCAFANGGSSGGGGGTAPANPADKFDIFTAAKTVRLDLYSFLSKESFDKSSPFLPYLNTSAQPSDSILHFILTNKIRVDGYKPCYDLNGTPVDGSIHGNPDEICISAFNLSQKLSKDNYRIQVMALVAHEYSHKVGANEAQATFLQNYVLNKMAANPNFKSEYAAFDLYHNLDEVIIKNRLLTDIKPNSADSDVCNNSKVLGSNFNKFSNLLRSYISSGDMPKFYAYQAKINAHTYGACSFVEDYFKTTYENIFYQKDVITAEEFDHWFYKNDLTYDLLYIHKIHDQTGSQNEAKEIDVYLYELREYIESLYVLTEPPLTTASKN